MARQSKYDERQIIEYIELGLTNSQIARRIDAKIENVSAKINKLRESLNPQPICDASPKPKEPLNAELKKICEFDLLPGDRVTYKTMHYEVSNIDQVLGIFTVQQVADVQLRNPQKHSFKIADYEAGTIKLRKHKNWSPVKTYHIDPSRQVEEKESAMPPKYIDGKNTLVTEEAEEKQEIISESAEAEPETVEETAERVANEIEQFQAAPAEPDPLDCLLKDAVPLVEPLPCEDVYCDENLCGLCTERKCVKQSDLNDIMMAETIKDQVNKVFEITKEPINERWAGKHVYIAGKITGLDDFKEKFEIAEIKLTRQGALPMNPAILPSGYKQEQYLHICFAMIDVCEAVCFLDNWVDSPGAHEELKYAAVNKKEIMYESNL